MRRSRLARCGSCWWLGVPPATCHRPSCSLPRISLSHPPPATRPQLCLAARRANRRLRYAFPAPTLVIYVFYVFRTFLPPSFHYISGQQLVCSLKAHAKEELYLFNFSLENNFHSRFSWKFLLPQFPAPRTVHPAVAVKSSHLTHPDITQIFHGLRETSISPNIGQISSALLARLSQLWLLRYP